MCRTLSHPVPLSPGLFGGYHKFGVTDRYSSDIQLHGKVFTRATAARSDGSYLSMYYRRCAGYQVSVCVLRFSYVGGPDLMKSSDTAMAEDFVPTGKILTTEL